MDLWAFFVFFLKKWFFIKFLNLKAVFASAIPELAQIIGNRPKYAGAYKVEKGKK